MKTVLLISLFVGIGLIVALSIFYVFQLPHYSLEIEGMKDTYFIGENYSFYYTLSGFGNTCGAWFVWYPNQNGEIIHNGEVVDCSRPTNKELSYDSRKDLRMFSSKVPEMAGTYNVTVSVDKIKDPVVFEFEVLSNLPSDCRLKYGKGTPEMLECMEKFREITSIPTPQEFLEMNCDDLTHIFPEFPSEEVADAWNTRMHECMNEQESLQSQASEPGIDKGIVAEMEDLQQMSCDEIIQRNTEGEYLSSDNREFAREKVLDCSDIEESFAVNASCEELFERYHSGQEYWFEDHKKITENRLAKCSGEENEN